jgi:oligopeptide/dipeptide ABC transporter ATP-binding protein
MASFLYHSSIVALLTISGLRKRFNLEAGFFARYGRFVNAVNDVSFNIGKNETYGLVGESGCGKTTTARLLVRMYEADGGTILYHRENSPSHDDAPVELASLRNDELRQYRQKVRYVFQDPARSLNPRMSVEEVLTSGMRYGTSPVSSCKIRDIAASALEEVGLFAADLDRRPAEFSGGQRQRISIARGLLPQPDLLICDEVVSALDVSIQAQILNLLLDIREKRAMSFLFIAHDLKVACYFCDRIGVMYSGEIMEEAPAENLWRNGHHPYTQMLFASATGLYHTSSSPTNDGTAAPGSVTPNTASKPKVSEKAESADSCCAFAARCPQASERCFLEKPLLTQITPDHVLRCHNK